ncbi:uncharacterized protein LOC132760235 [Ruditapes philippinarum]|uniref:uncharacterized protein LOC132760235 n=1 Tax=Ruditapes philippinarum TaxID=129788 RepID=UPI00295C0011|nr:uncharacterized protein LOC132760235 [Ruditapes philippinarum]
MSALETSLVFWPEESAWSLVQNSALETGATIGSKTRVKFKCKKYLAILIAKVLKSKGKKFQGYLNSLLFEEETADDIIRRTREEYSRKTMSPKMSWMQLWMT